VIGSTRLGDLDDLVRSKSAAGRRKDQPVLDIIEEYREHGAE